ncbi:hypothetical protein Lepto1489_22540 (plasmid) [Leptospira interrogans serovar Bataviae]|uniref:Uncharacterized protein n=2 Tax=Leptospira interrogans TaxID=173 RepID=A0A0E2DLI0_LEPIR|nr:hypothetical protein LEP1GSC105_4252 [Leptospira interrogans str. UI 12758]EMN92996.1 hypothetical protein LEP1GSC110_0243 [Leptospira interrogans serovar Medanensis str. UT053]KAA1293002.1 hypothetical protein C4X99_03870 [Leptospira interrogans serovar Geyaweera]MCR8638991.1 hypothetical protein [Leptospira interrogans serovar Ricardi]QOI53151.1 hypothetical protein Lepto1489_22540 [Leptospira interrogans serovar Bataviae]
MTHSLLEKFLFPVKFLKSGFFLNVSFYFYKRTKFIFRNYWSFIFKRIPLFTVSVVKRNENRPFDSIRIVVFGFELVVLFYKK